MKKLIYTMFFLFTCFVLPTIAVAQPHHVEYRYPKVAHTYPGYVYRCYTAWLPLPHEVCEYVRVYTPNKHHYRPLPPPRPNNHRPHPPVHNQPRHNPHR